MSINGKSSCSCGCLSETQAASSSTKSYAYYPGCSLEGTAHDFEMSTRQVLKHLGVELKEIEDWSCCGATAAHCTDHLLSIALPARNLIQAQKQGNSSLVVSCAACFSRLKTAAHELAHDSELKADVETVVEEKYQGGVDVQHSLNILLNDIGLDQISKATVKPLSGLKVVTYYGCLLVRPPKVMQFDDVENPTSMDKVLQAAGANVCQWGYKTECCGASLTLSRTDLVHDLVLKILNEARDVGADLIAVACPLCQANLDMRQLDLKTAKKIDYQMPVLYFTQLLGLAFGLSGAQLGISKLMISAKEQINKIQTAAAARASEV